MPNLVLIGLPGCGKSYWGALLSNQLAIPFYDLDTLIEQKTGRKIAQLFAQDGEEHFRTIEQETLLHFFKTNTSQNYILACGGGTPAYDKNMDMINSYGKSLFLDQPIERIIHNLSAEEQANRPLLKNGANDQLVQLLDVLRTKRLPYYMQAQFIIADADINLDNLKEIYFYE